MPPGPTQSVYLQNGHGQQPDAATFVAAAAVVANTPNSTAARPNSLAFIVVIPSEYATECFRRAHKQRKG